MVYLATILLASALVQSSVASGAWNDPTSSQYHIQTDEGPERYFKYQTQNGQYRKEKRLEDGTVIGTYAWIDDNGYLRQRDYVADGQGYRIVKNKNIFVGRSVNIGDAIKATKKLPNNYDSSVKLHPVPQVPVRGYRPAAPTQNYPISNALPSVEVSLNSIPSSTPLPPLSTPYSNQDPIDIGVGYISTTLSPPSNTYTSSTTAKPTINTYIIPEAPSRGYIPSTTPVIPASQYIPSSTSTESPRIHIPARDFSPPNSPKTAPPFITSNYLRPFSTTISPSSSSYAPPSTPRPFIHSSTTPSNIYIESSTSRPPFEPSSTPSSVYIPSTTYSPIYTSIAPPLPSYVPPSTPEYLSITPPPRRYYPNQFVDSNSLDYSESTNYDEYQGEFVNPYIHQNGPTYPIDSRGHSFNPTYNKLGNGYDPQYPYYDGISVTNDGFRYYIPRAYHEEQSDNTNRKSGSFGYIDPFGIRRVIYYNAGPEGFKHRKNNRYVGFNATPYDPRPY